MKKKELSITKEWIEEKTLELCNEILLESHRGNYFDMSENFIRKLIEQIAALIKNQPTITEEFIEKWVDIMKNYHGRTMESRVINMLKEAGYQIAGK